MQTRSLRIRAYKSWRVNTTGQSVCESAFEEA